MKNNINIRKDVEIKESKLKGNGRELTKNLTKTQMLRI